MLENIGAVGLFALLGFLAVMAIRRRAKMTPEQRKIARLEYKQRRLERELEDHERYGD